MNNEEIIICEQCNGKGIIKCSTLEDYHQHIYEYWDEDCKKCEGSGRLIKKSTVEYFPYKIPKEVK